MRKCASCKLDKPATLEFFQKHSGHSDGMGPYCRPCHRRLTKDNYQKNKAHYVAYAAKKRAENYDVIVARERVKSRKRTLEEVGITEEDFAIVLRNQGGLCGLCKGLLTNQHIDHDHKTGKFRGILCAKCNVGLGAFGDDVPGLEKAIAYLKRAEFVLVHRKQDADVAEA